MADITITIPNPVLNRVIDALCAAGGWDDSKGPKPAYAKAVLIDHIRRTVRNVEESQAVAAAEAAARAEVTDVDGLS